MKRKALFILQQQQEEQSSMSDSNAEKISGFELKVAELENNIATLNTEKSDVQTQYDLEHQKVEDLSAENETLKQYKLSRNRAEEQRFR